MVGTDTAIQVGITRAWNHEKDNGMTNILVVESVVAVLFYSFGAAFYASALYERVTRKK